MNIEDGVRNKLRAYISFVTTIATESGYCCDKREIRGQLPVGPRSNKKPPKSVVFCFIVIPFLLLPRRVLLSSLRLLL